MRQTSKAWLIVPPLVFLVKDIIGAIALLSTEPGITERATFYYWVSLFPSVLFVNSPALAVFVNILFGLLIGLNFYVYLGSRRIWPIIVLPSIFLFKDIVVQMATTLLIPSETTHKASLYYSIAMLPGSLFHKIGDPRLFNVSIGVLLGLGLYLHAKKNAAQRG